MLALWEQSDRSVCIHPGWAALHGWKDIADSWARIFAGPGRNQFIITNVEVTVEGTAAWVTCDENLVSGGTAGTIAATNVFVRAADGWQLTVHHGGPVMPQG